MFENRTISSRITRYTSITKSKNLIVWCKKPLDEIMKKCGVYKIILKNVTLLTNNKVKVSTNVNNVVQMFIFPYVIFQNPPFFIDRSVDWRKKYKSVLENVLRFRWLKNMTTDTSCMYFTFQYSCHRFTYFQ